MPTTTPVETAEQLHTRARDADNAARALEDLAATGEHVDLADIDQHKAAARRFRFDAGIARKRTQVEAEQARMASLADLGNQIQAAATDVPADAITAKLEQLSAAAAAVRKLAADHDQAVTRFRSRGQELGARGCGPGGPRADCAFIAITRTGVRSDTVELQRIGDIGALINAAVTGQPVNVPPSVLTHQPIPQPAHAVLGRGGVIHGIAEITEGVQSQIDTGSSVVLTDAELRAWWAGRFDTSSIDYAARGVAQVAAAKAREAARWEQIRAAQRETIERNEQAALEYAAAKSGRY